jgi:hypothetical protein
LTGRPNTAAEEGLVSALAAELMGRRVIG